MLWQFWQARNNYLFFFIRPGFINRTRRLRAVTDLLGFQRIPNERTDELLTRFETIRHRARQTAGFDMGIPGISFMLLRAVGVTTEQQNQLLAQFQGRLPSDEVEYLNMCSYLRRMAHVIEHSPYNIGASMNNRQSHQKQSSVAQIRAH